MKRRRPQGSRPPEPGGQYVWGGIHEVICEEEKAGRPLAPLVELLSPRLRPEDEAELLAKPTPSDAPSAPTE